MALETAAGEQNNIIDTAIVIKNIPFEYPGESFVTELFPQLGLVRPYAFNYHRKQSDCVFHGLAFANFNESNDAQAAVDTLNNYELNGRKLRVELKKKQPPEEKQQQMSTGEQDVQSPMQFIEWMRMTSNIVDPLLRPRLVFPEPTPQTGTLRNRFITNARPKHE
jgi:RNA recognition motif-containing protein